MTGMTNDMYNFLIKRCYDLAACTPKNVTVTINEDDIKIRDFRDYIKLYYDDKWWKYQLPIRFSSNSENDVWGYGAKKLANEIIQNIGLEKYNKYLK